MIVFLIFESFLYQFYINFVSILYQLIAIQSLNQVNFSQRSKDNGCNGEVAERLKAAVLKTVEGYPPSQGSNPCLSAKLMVTLFLFSLLYYYFF